MLKLLSQEDIKNNLSDCISIQINGVESTTMYKNLSKGLYPATIYDWTGLYPDPEGYLKPLLSCNDIDKHHCKQGESVASGSFWTSQSIQDDLTLSDQLLGEESFRVLNIVEKAASRGSAYLPVWLVTPKVWVQNYLSPPEFDAAGQLILGRLRQL